MRGQELWSLGREKKAQPFSVSDIFSHKLSWQKGQQKMKRDVLFFYVRLWLLDDTYQQDICCSLDSFCYMRSHVEKPCLWHNVINENKFSVLELEVSWTLLNKTINDGWFFNFFLSSPIFLPQPLWFELNSYFYFCLFI